jgi:hypothetical protein
MAYVKRTKNEDGAAPRNAAARPAPGKTLEAKPRTLDRAELERLYDDVTRRIPKTLSILAK